MSMFTLRRSQKQSGFTLMELLIVIAVLGLLLGMLIPRLAGVTDDTVDTVCDTNNKGIRYYTQAYVNKNNALPNNLTNLVDMSSASHVFGTSESDSTGTAVPANLASFQDDYVDGAEVLAEEFYTRNVPGAWKLSAAEVKELKAMGISTVYNLQGANRAMEKHTLATDSVVMMSGFDNNTGSAAAFTFAEGYALGNPEWLGRIMMAVNDKCDLVKDGYIQASALCPGAVLAEEDFSHKEYILVLPRLEDTVDTLTASGGLLEDVTDLEFIDSSAVESSALVSSLTSYRVVDFTFEAQSAWEFDMSCPEGHKWPDNDEDAWIQVTTSVSSGGTVSTALGDIGGGSTYE